jgi:hypothetical protein
MYASVQAVDFSDLKEETMRAAKYVAAVILLIPSCFVLLAPSPTAASAQGENHCFICHTSARDLIKITREIEATRPKPKASAESEGEG